MDRVAAPSAVTHRTWDEEWVTVRCGACGRENQWPHPELGCHCGVVLRIPVSGGPGTPGPAPQPAAEADEVRGTPPVGEPADPQEPTPGHHPPTPGDHPPTPGDHAPTPDAPEPTPDPPSPAPGPPELTPGPRESAPGPASSAPGPRGSTPGPRPSAATPGASAASGGAAGSIPRVSGTARRSRPRPAALPRVTASARPAFQPVTIRTARDAVTAAALYLRWLGYQDVRRADQRPPNGIGLAARGLLAQVDPTVRPASLRDVECLWLTAMTESAGCVYFSLAGYADDARAVADRLGVPLFVLDLTGTPQPVNSLADDLVATGA
ncbi:hypothetical protein ABZ455_09780 [Streptomyces avermitilis]